MLFPAFGILLVAVIWTTTLTLIRVERTAVEHNAEAASRELVETYEAQVLRAFREIDQTLKFVKHIYELQRRYSVLHDLKAQNMLPPDLIFSVSIADARGTIVSSTRPTDIASVADEDTFRDGRVGHSLVVGVPRKGPGGDWQIRFGRRLDNADGTFAGMVMVGVDAAYFVSGYEPSRLGNQGVLGVVGSDGFFRARRVGDLVTAGDVVDFDSLAPLSDDTDPTVVLSQSSWDGVWRYTSARRLFQYPFAVFVGLAQEEQFAVAQRHLRSYLWWAAAASVVLLAAVGTMGRMSWQLALSRRRTAMAQASHAERVEYLAYHDTLTTLPNRSLFTRLLMQNISQARRYNTRLAVLFVDLDHFKQINDSLGHDAGDQLLREIAVRLKSCLRESDTVARLGGDEFVAMLPALAEDAYVATVAQKILAALAKPVLLRGEDYRITASIGISIFPQDGQDIDSLTRSADIAMYQAKESGKNNYQFYSANGSVKSLELLTLETGLRHALEHREFALQYQAMRDSHTGRVTAAEALLRWEHPELGTVAPMRFIPVAEMTGLIVPIGKWVLATACAQNMAWQRQGLSPICMAVNISPRQFLDEHLLADIKEILGTTGMDAGLLELEISESLLLQNFDRTLTILIGLKSAGIRIAVDDFGNGYSALAALQDLPVDKIKISRALIGGITTGAQDNAQAKAIIAMGKKLSLSVIAQGVETQAQADFLRDQDCDEFQGFYFSEPASPARMAELLQEQADARTVRP